MKKIIIILLAALSFTACEKYTDQFYDDLDKVGRPLNPTQIDITLTDDDYSDIGGDPEKISSFSDDAPAIDYLPKFLDDVYVTLDEGSVINVTYKYYSKPTIDEEDAYEIGSVRGEYQLMGQKYDNFSNEDVAEASIVKLINSYGSFSLSGKDVEKTFKYEYTYTENVPTYIKVNDDFSTEILSEWEGNVIELDSAAYEFLGSGKYYNFSNNSQAQSKVEDYAKSEKGKGAGVYLCKVFTRQFVDRFVVLIFDGEKWSILNSVNLKTDQYIKTSKGWIFDPTVLYTIEKEDFQVIVDYVKATYGEEFIDSYGTAEFYFGAGSHFENFDIRDGKFNKEKFASWEDAVAQGLVEAFLPSKFPDAKKELEGTPIYYVVTFATYDGVNVNYSMKFEVTKEGPDAEFKYVEGSLK